MTKKKLLNPKEVPILSGYKDLPECELVTLCTVVDYEFLKCLGVAFKDLLEGKLKCYENIEWCPTDDGYSLGDVRVRKGVYFISLKDENKDEPSLKNFECWGLAPKFESQVCTTSQVIVGCDENGEYIYEDKETCTCDYNSFWCDHLGPYLSLLVVRKNIINLEVKIQDKGLVEYIGEGYRSISAKKRDAIIYNIDASKKMKWELMHEYMINNNESGCFDLYKGIGNGCCKSCGKCGCDNSCTVSKKSRNNYVIC